MLGIMDEMKADGYFKKGILGDLSDEQAFRNYDKALVWSDNGNIPEFLKNDMRKYIKQNKQIDQKDKKLLSNVKNL